MLFGDRFSAMTFSFRLTPSRRKALALGLIGLLAAAFAAVLLPPPFEIVAALAISGLSLLGASILLDATLRQEIERIFAVLGEIKVRLAQTNMRVESLSQRMDAQPMTEADAAPARATIAELSAEVGILGSLLQNVAQTLGDHETRLETRLSGTGAENAAPPKTAPAKAAPLVAVADAPVTPAVRASERRSENSDFRADAAEDIQAMHLAVDEARAEEIAAAIGKAAIEIHLQPVVALPQRRTVGYEAFVRLRISETNLLLPAEFLNVVEERGLATTLDALVLTRVLAIARYLASRPGEQFVSCNISPVTWANPRSVASIARLIENYRAFAPRLVMEIPQRVFRALDPTSLGLLGSMSATGARFALDQLVDLRLDPASLSDRGVRFVKAPAGLLAAAGEGRIPLEIEAADLAPLLARAGIIMIGEKVEDDRVAADLIDLNIVHAQGLLFAPPRLARPEIFAEPKEWSPAQDVVPTAADMAAAPAELERRSFRSVLRQASA